VHPAAHERGLTVVVHASSAGAFAMALNSGAEVITHAPRDQALAPAEVSRMGPASGSPSPR
jgi:hypothetical protein